LPANLKRDMLEPARLIHVFQATRLHRS
jgi:hypothetical protein